ncbi:MAG: TonB-dependent receptor [Pseudomonadota bacterium]
MTSIVTRPAHPARTPLVLAIAIAAAFPVSLFAQATQEKILAPVVVTSSRFASDPSLAPIGATVITAEEIRNAGVDNVNQAIRKIGGVYGRQSSFGSQDFDLDLRGFGVASSQNMVVLVDGVRLSENEGLAPIMSSIPVDSVERIEIIRGGSSVLYGDGATGGVINIITKRATQPGLHGSVTAEIGQLGHRDVRSTVSRNWGSFALDANVSKQRADNYRDNNAIDQENFSGGAQWTSAEGRFGIRADIARQDSRLAGGLSLAQYQNNPRQTLTPKQYAVIDTDRYTAFIERRFGAWEAAAELSHRERTTLYGTDGTSPMVYKGRQTQFSPRIRNLRSIDGMINELVVGFDLIRWNRDVDSSFSQQRASQKSRAVYARDELRVGKARVALGARHEVFDKDSVDPAPFSTATYSSSQALNAWELQGSYEIAPLVNLFAKAGQSYRVANVDENGFTAVPNRPLNPQTSHDLELGASVGNAENRLTAKLFRHRLRNEIFFDPTIGFFGANGNLDPTRRQGVEVETSTRIAKTFRLSAQWQHVNAEFTDGVNAGKEMVLVPKNTVSMRLSWLPGDGQTADIGAQWVGSQRYGGDFSNSCSAVIPSYTTLDGRYARRVGQWEFAVIGNNLTDKNYFSQAYSCRGGIYPSAGRQIKVSARYDF